MRIGRKNTSLLHFGNRKNLNQLQTLLWEPQLANMDLCHPQPDPYGTPFILWTSSYLVLADTVALIENSGFPFLTTSFLSNSSIFY